MASSQNPQQTPGSHRDFNELTHDLFQNSWGGQWRRILAIKGKTPSSKPRDLFYELGFFFLPLASSEVYECQSPGDSSELPGYLDTSLPAQITLPTTYSTLIRFLFPTPLDNVIPLASY